jgi:hypothetical protein
MLPPWHHHNGEDANAKARGNTNVLIDRRVAVLDRAVGRHARAANHANEIALAQQLRGELAFAEPRQEGIGRGACVGRKK